jgi:thiamine transport system ATP-binding protein
MIRLLEAVELTLEYPDFHACYTLSVPAGALCGLIGPSGGGKTTLLHAIAGFEIPTGGALRFAGRDLLPLKPAERPLSILFQDHNLFPHLTAAQNVGLGINPRLRLSRDDAATVAATLERVGLGGLGGRRPAELSGGQRQRVAIARALVRRRPLMLLDEPFGGLDPGLRREMIALVDRLRRDEGLTVLVSIHTPEDLRGVADLLAFIADGRVLAAAPPEAVLTPGIDAAVDRYLGA